MKKESKGKEVKKQNTSEEIVNQQEAAERKAELKEVKEEVESIMKKHGFGKIRKIKLLFTDSSEEQGASMGDLLMKPIYYDDNPNKDTKEAFADEYIINVDNFDKYQIGGDVKSRPLYDLMNEMGDIQEEIYKKEDELLKKQEEIRKHMSKWLIDHGLMEPENE